MKAPAFQSEPRKFRISTHSPPLLSLYCRISQATLIRGVGNWTERIFSRQAA